MNENSNDMIQTKIGIDFSEAIKEVAEFSEKVEALSTDFRKLSGDVHNASRTSISNMIQQHLKSIDTSKLDVNVKTELVEKINKAVAGYVLDKGIAIKNDGKPIEVDFNLDSSDAKALSRAISSKIVDGINTDSLKGLKVKMTPDNIKSLNEKFSATFNKAVSKGISVEFYNKNSKEKLGVSIGKNHMDLIVNQIQKKLMTYINSKNFLTWGEEDFKPIDKSVMTESVNKIREAVLSMEQYLKSSDEIFKDIPNMGNTIKQFRNSLGSVLVNINNVTKSIMSIGVGENYTKGIEKVREQLAGLEKSTLNSAAKLVKEAGKQIATYKGGSIDESKFKNFMQNIGKRVEDDILKNMLFIEKTILQSVSSATVSKSSNIGDIAASIQTTLQELTQKAVSEIQTVRRDIDVSLVNSTLAAWAESVGKDINIKMKAATDELTISLLSSSERVKDEFVKSIKTLAAFKMGEAGAESINVNEYMNNIKSHIDTSIKTYMESIASDLKTVVSSEGDINVGKSVKPLRASVNVFLDTMVSKVSEMMMQEAGKNPTLKSDNTPEKNLSKYAAKLQRETRKLTETMINSAMSTIKMMSEDFGGSMMNNVSPKERNKIRQAVESSFKEAIETISNNLSKVISALVASADIMSLVESHVKSGLINAFNQPVEPTKAVDLTSIADAALANIESSLKAQISGVSLDEDATKGYNRSIQSAIQHVITSTIDKIAITTGMSKTGEGETSIPGLDSNISKQFVLRMNSMINKYMRSYISALSKVMTPDNIAPSFAMKTSMLHPEVKSAIARSMNVSVRDLVRNVPKLTGSEDMKLVLSESLNVLFEKFQDAMGTNMTSMLKAYKEEIKNLEFTPNMSPIEVLTMQMNAFQQEVVAKAKQMIEQQFRVLIKELKAMKIIPSSLGATNVPDQMLKAATPARGRKSTRSIVTKEVSESDTLSLPGIPALDASHVGSLARKPDIFNNRTIMGSIFNTLRYIVAGQLIGQPLMGMASESWETTKSMDYELEKARQNVLAKYRGSDAGSMFYEYAKNNVEYRYKNRDKLGNLGIEEGVYLDPEQKAKVIEKMRTQMADIINGGIVTPLQNIAIGYGIGQKEMATMWQISTRAQDNPINAFAMTSAAARVYATEREEIDPVEAAKGMESLVGQYNLTPAAKDKRGNTQIGNFANMMIKASLLSQGSSKDFIDAMSRSGALWNAFLPKEMPVERKFATGLAYQSLFMQATGRPGTEAATFFRNILGAPFTADTANYLVKLSQTPDKVVSKVNPFETSYDSKGVKTTKQKSMDQLLPDIINASMYLKQQGNAQEATKLLSKMFKTRTFGYEQGLETVFTKLFESFEANGIKNFEDYINRIDANKADLTGEIDEYIGGLSTTFEFKQDRTKSAFQAASYSLLKELKPEFSKTMDVLTNMLNGIRDNAGAITQVLGIATNLLLAVGAKRLLTFGADKVKSEFYGREALAETKGLMTTRAGMVRHRFELAEDYRNISNQLAERMGIKAEKADAIIRAEADVSEKEEAFEASKARYKSSSEYTNKFESNRRHIANLDEALKNTTSPEKRAAIMQKKQQAMKELQSMVDADDVSVYSQGALSDMKKDYIDKHRALEQSRLTARNLRGEVGNLDIKSDYDIRSAGVLHKSITSMDASIGKTTAQIDRLKGTFISLGADEKHLETAMIKADIQARKDVTNKRQIVTSTNYFTEAMDRLNRELDEGYINADQYRRKLKELNQGNPEAAKGPGGFRSMLGMGAKFALAGYAMDAATQIGSSFMMSDADRASSSAEGVKKTSELMYSAKQSFDAMNKSSEDKSKSWSSSLNPFYGLGNTVSWTGKTVGVLGKGLIDGLNNWLTGGGMSFSDQWKAYWSASQGGSLTDILEATNYNQKRKEADKKLGAQQRAEEEMLTKDWVDINGDGRKEVNPAIYEGSLETLQATLSRIQMYEKSDESNSSTKFQETRAGYLMKGYSENSPEIVEAEKVHYQDMINIFKNSKEAFQTELETLVKINGRDIVNSEKYLMIEEQLNEAKQKTLDYELKLHDLAEKELTLMNQKFDMELKGQETATNTTLTNMIVAGGRKDSIEALDIQKTGTRRQLTLLEGHLTNLQSKYATSDVQNNNDLKLKYENDILDIQGKINSAKSSISDIEDNYTTSISNDYRRKLSLSSPDYSVRKSLLEAQGYDTESSAYKSVEKEELNDKRSKIEEEIRKQQALLTSPDLSKYQREDVLVQIKNLQAESAKTLADMYKLYKQNSNGWGLPSGIKPITSYAYDTSRNTERVYTIQQGDTYLTVKFDTVNGANKDEIETNIVGPIKDAVSNLNRGMTTDLNRQVQSYVGNRKY